MPETKVYSIKEREILFPVVAVSVNFSIKGNKKLQKKFVATKEKLYKNVTFCLTKRT